MTYQLKKISAEDTYAIRLPILRPGKPIESCVFDGDNLESTIHIGIFLENKKMGVCSLFKNSNALFSESLQYQLRGMAVLKSHQSQGLGRLLLQYSEKLLKSQQVNLIWCNAREIATGFYANNSYRIIDKPFMIKTVGLHYVMYKPI